MSVAMIILVGLSLLFSATVQGIAGFAYALFAMPMLMLAGMPLPEASMVVMITYAPMAIYAAIHMRKHALWRQASLVGTIAVLAIPIGLWLQVQADQLDPGVAQQLIGGLVLTLLIMQRLTRVKPREHVPWGWGVAAGGAMGVLAGFANTGGPPLVLWALAHKWPNLTMRGTMIVCFMFGGMALLPGRFVSMGYALETQRLWSSTLLGVAMIPVAGLGIWGGLRLGHRLPINRLRSIITGVLALVALAAIVMPMLKPWLIRQ